jgi:hypothetical protein
MGCRDFYLHRSVQAYKAPSLFVPDLSLWLSHPERAWEKMSEKKLKTLVGLVRLRVRRPTPFRNLGYILEGMEKENNTMILPIQLCDSDGTFGFVIEKQFQLAQNPHEGGLPPSTYPNPVPTLP